MPSRQQGFDFFCGGTIPGGSDETMCGIAGHLNLDPAQPAERTLLSRMATALAHRGPDGEGLHTDGPLGLVNRRLSIIDLSPAAAMPMSNEDGTVWLTFNGEIYNFQELRAFLTRRGHRFRSGADSEVILHLYEEHGPACVATLRGMFAFALWDGPRRRLLLARDRVGVKPLLYHLSNGRLSFASEFAALLQDPAIPRELDAESLGHYLTLGYIPAPRSIFRGVQKLPPGHVLLWEDGSARQERYWDLRYDGPPPVSRDAAEEECRALLAEATTLRLVADVPVGAFLSGGIDSSAVVACMAARASGPVHTFSVGFAEAEYDETPHARHVAQHFGTHHTELRVTLEAVKVLPDLAWHYGEPFADSSAIPSFAVSRLARQHVTVVLNGDGGDESFAGYYRHLAIARPPGLPAPLAALLRAVGRAGAWTVWGNRLARFATAADLPPPERYLRWQTLFDAPAQRAILAPEVRAAASPGATEVLYRGTWARFGAADPLAAALAADVAFYLPDDLLAKMDIATMAHSLEARSPFLDHHLMEFAARLPSRWKIPGLQTKRFLRRALRGMLPPETLRREKAGFAVPVARWLRHDLYPVARDLLCDSRARSRGLLDPAAVSTLLEEHRSGRANHGARLWGLLMLELWCRTFLDPPAPTRFTL